MRKKTSEFISTSKDCFYYNCDQLEAGCRKDTKTVILQLTNVYALDALTNTTTTN